MARSNRARRDGGEWDQIGAQGFLDPPAPNSPAPAPETLEGNTGPADRSGFWSRSLLPVTFDETGEFQMKRKALPYAPSVASASPGTDLPASNASSTVFDNHFLLGLRAFAWVKGQGGSVGTSYARGSSAPAQGGPAAKLALRPKIWPWGQRVTAWPTSVPRYPTFGEGR